MAYPRPQLSFVDSRDGYDHGGIRTRNEINPEAAARQSINIPVVAATGPWYPSATYPGFRGPSATSGIGQTDGATVQQSKLYAAEPTPTKSYRSSMSTQLSRSGQVPLASGMNAYTDATMVENSTGFYSGETSRKRSEGMGGYPMPVSSQVVYTPRVVPAGSSEAAGKVAVALSRKAAYQPGVTSNAAAVSQPRFRQIPVVVVPRQDGTEHRVQRQGSYQDAAPQSTVPVSNKNVAGGSVATRSRSVDHTNAKEAEVDALTDLLVQNMNVAGNPDFCGNLAAVFSAAKFFTVCQV